MSGLNSRGYIKSSESAIGHHMRRMDHLSNACEGDENRTHRYLESAPVIFVNEIQKPYYHRFVSPRFLGI